MGERGTWESSCLHVATGNTSFSKARSTAQGREQQERKVEGLVRARGPTNKPREEVSLGSGDGSNSCTRDQHHKIFMSLAFCKKPT